MNKENGAGPDPTRRLRKNLAEVVHDVTAMAELQTRLFFVDLKECRARAVSAVIMGVVALLIFLGCVPVLLAAASIVLAEQTRLSLGGAFFCVVGAGLGISALLGWIAWRRFASTFSALGRSGDEFGRNLTWFKTVLRKEDSSTTD